MTAAFVHLRLHTEYSLSDGIVRVPQLMDATAAAGMPAVGLTDECNLFAMVKFYRAAQARGIKPIIGVDVRLREAVDHNPDPGIVEVHLDARVARVEIAPGVAVDAWTYDGSIPGPLIRARAGDRLIVRFTNHLPQPTTVHWHGLRIPIQMDGVPEHSQAEVQPDGSFTYDFVVADAGLFWYHPHVMSAAQVGFGLYGALLVEDPADGVGIDDDESFPEHAARITYHVLRGGGDVGSWTRVAHHAIAGVRQESALGKGAPRAVRGAVVPLPQVGLLGARDDLDLDAAAVAHAIDQQIAVARVAHRGGARGAHVAHAEPVARGAEAAERVDDLGHRGLGDLAGLEHVAAQAQRQPVVLDHADGSAGRLGHHEPDRIRPHVDDADAHWIAHVRGETIEFGVQVASGICGGGRRAVG